MAAGLATGRDGMKPFAHGETPPPPFAGGPVLPAELAAWPMTTNGLNPAAAFGWALSTMPPTHTRDHWTLGNGTLVGCLATAAVTTEITTLGCLVTGGGSGGAGANGMVLADARGGELSITDDMSSELGSTGWAEGLLARPVLVQQGHTYTIAVLASFTSPCSLAGRSGLAHPAIGGLRPAVRLTGVTTLGSFDAASGTALAGDLLVYGR